MDIKQFAAETVAAYDAKYRRVKRGSIVFVGVDESASIVRRNLLDMLERSPRGTYEYVGLVDLSYDDVYDRNSPRYNSGDDDADSDRYDDDYEAFDDAVAAIVAKDDAWVCRTDHPAFNEASAVILFNAG